MVEERRLRSDVFLMFGAKVAMTVLNVGSSVIVARALGPTGRGTVAVALALTMVLVQLGTFGLTSANPFFTAQDLSQRDGIVANSLVIAFTLGGALVLAGLAVKAVVPSITRGLSWAELAIAMAAIPAMLGALFLHSVLLGEGRTLAYNLVDLVLSVAAVVAQAVVLLVLHWGVIGALGVLLGSQIVAALTWLGILARGGLRPRPDRALARRTLQYAFRIYVAGLVAFLVIRVDMLMVNGYLGPRQAGLYSVAVAFADGLYLLPTVIAVNLFARVARGLGGDATAAIFRSFAVIYAVVCAISVVFAGLAVRVLYGPPFQHATSLYYWLAPGVFCLGLINILAQHFAGSGFPREAMLVWLPGLALNIVMNAVLLPREGVYIASLTSSLTYLLILVLHMRLFARERGGWHVMRPRLGEVVRFVRVALSRTAPEPTT